MPLAIAASRMRERWPAVGLNSPFSQRETVACVEPAKSANSCCVKRNTSDRICDIGRVMVSETHNTHTHANKSSDHAETHLLKSKAQAHDDEMTSRELIRVMRDLMSHTGWDQTKLAANLKVTQPTVSRWFAGAEPKYSHRLAILALAKKHNVIHRAYALDEQGIPLVGYVGAGGQVVYDEAQGPFGTAEMPPVKTPPQTVALKVRGDSMSPQLENDWTVYYDTRADKPSESLTNKLCVIGLTDGRVLVKTLFPGHAKGTWDLHSKNAAPLFDQPVLWAARVTFIAPSK
jgi:SOS-response transcriptional repressor LexA